MKEKKRKKMVEKNPRRGKVLGRKKVEESCFTSGETKYISGWACH